MRIINKLMQNSARACENEMTRTYINAFSIMTSVEQVELQKICLAL